MSRSNSIPYDLTALGDEGKACQFVDRSERSLTDDAPTQTSNYFTTSSASPNPQTYLRSAHCSLPMIASSATTVSSETMIRFTSGSCCAWARQEATACLNDSKRYYRGLASRSGSMVTRKGYKMRRPLIEAQIYAKEHCRPTPKRPHKRPDLAEEHPSTQRMIQRTTPDEYRWMRQSTHDHDHTRQTLSRACTIARRSTRNVPVQFMSHLPYGLERRLLPLEAG